MLAKRLARHGLAVPGGTLAAVLSQKVASAGVPNSVMTSAIKAVTSVAASQVAAAGVLSPQVAALTEGVLKAMLLTKLRIVTAVVLVAAILGGVTGLAYQTLAGETHAARQNQEQPGNTPGPQPKRVAQPDGNQVQVASQAEEAKPADLPDKATARQPRLRMTIDGHHAPVMSVAYSPDGKTLASGSYDNTIKFWDVKTGKERATLKGHTDAVNSVAYSPDGKTLASGSLDRTIKLWDVKTGKERATLKGHTSGVCSVAYSPDGKTLASCGDNIKLWDVKTGKERATLKGHTAAVYSVAYSPGGKTLASGSWDGTVRLWDVKTGKERATLKGSTTSLAYSPDGKTLATGGANTIGTWAAGERNTLKLWDVKTGKVSYTLEEMWDVDSVAYSPDGKTLALGNGVTTYLWDVATGKELFSLKDNHGATYTVAYSPDGKLLASAGKDRTNQTVGREDGHGETSGRGRKGGRLRAIAASGCHLCQGHWPRLAHVIKSDGALAAGQARGSIPASIRELVSVTKVDGPPTFIQKLHIKVIGTSIFAENFNRYSGIQNAVQWQSGLKVAHSGSVTGWTKTGENAVHAVDNASPTAPRSVRIRGTGRS